MLAGMDPRAEAKAYDEATVDRPLVETKDTVLPRSKAGMLARKRALRERRAISAALAAELAAPEPVAPDVEVADPPKPRRKTRAKKSKATPVADDPALD